jgi:hypothetical protein
LVRKLFHEEGGQLLPAQLVSSESNSIMRLNLRLSKIIIRKQSIVRTPQLGAKHYLIFLENMKNAADRAQKLSAPLSLTSPKILVVLFYCDHNASRSANGNLFYKALYLRLYCIKLFPFI